MRSLDSASRRALLQLARASIRQRLLGDGSLDRLLGELSIDSALDAPRGAFVTIRHAASPGSSPTLRGCIGTVVTEKPLYTGVIDLAPRAALGDPRFPPITPDELEASRIEISALSALRPVLDVESIVVGRDGLELTAGGARAVFLPHVAVEQAWSREKLLEQLARKAGLAESGWRGAELKAFEADVFSETDG